jgi:hypothetical protein
MMSSVMVARVPNPAWRALYRAGAVMAALFVLLTLVSIVTAAIWPLPTGGGVATLPGGFTTLRYIATHRTAFIANELLLLAPVVGTLVVWLALYAALERVSRALAAIGAALAIASVIAGLPLFSQVLGLVSLADVFATAPDAQRVALATTADGIIVQVNAVSAGAILLPAGIVLLSAAMLRGVFHRGVAYLGLVAGVAGVLGEALRPILSPGLYSVYGVLLFVWLAVVGWRLWRLGASPPVPESSDA